MGDHTYKIHIKNSGSVIVFITFFWSIWHTLVYLDNLSQQGEFLLRCIGVVLITLMAYAPYAFLNYVLDKVAYPFFLLGSAVILIFADVTLRTAIIFGLIDPNGFFVIFLFPLFFIINIVLVIFLTWLYQLLINEKARTQSLFLLLRKFMNAIIRKRIL